MVRPVNGHTSGRAARVHLCHETSWIVPTGFPSLSYSFGLPSRVPPVLSSRSDRSRRIDATSTSGWGSKASFYGFTTDEVMEVP